MDDADQRPVQAFTQSMWGEYFVRYNDGYDSACMPKSTANDYAKMFGGTVHRHPYFLTPAARRAAWRDFFGSVVWCGIIILVIAVALWKCAP